MQAQKRQRSKRRLYDSRSREISTGIPNPKWQMPDGDVTEYQPDRQIRYGGQTKQKYDMQE